MTATAEKKRKTKARVSKDSDAQLEKFLNSPLFGLWRDREDIGNPAEWVRSIRKPRAFDWPDGENAQ